MPLVKYLVPARCLLFLVIRINVIGECFILVVAIVRNPKNTGNINGSTCPTTSSQSPTQPEPKSPSETHRGLRAP